MKKKIVFTEEFCRPENLFPFTLTRRIQDIRVGIRTIREKWEQFLGIKSYDRKEGNYKDLPGSVDIENDIEDDFIYLIHSNILPDPVLVKQVKKLKPGECLALRNGTCIVHCTTKNEINESGQIQIKKTISYGEPVMGIDFPWNIFQMNSRAISLDFEEIRNIKYQKISSTNRVINSSDILIEKGATVEHCLLNASEGPVYIGKNALVMEGSMIRGPVAICENATVKMGSKIYGATTIGPWCTVGGEIKNSVLFGYSNKAHDGYLGDSVLGEWCNMGAGSSNSNVKNTASDISVWTGKGSVSVGIKCGVLMGDYSRTAINTSINTGTVTGVSCNIFGAGLTPKYIPSFSWGSEGKERYRFEKALSDIQNWKNLKQQSITENEKNILKHIFEHF